jgi:hypothetical protein
VPDKRLIFLRLFKIKPFALQIIGRKGLFFLNNTTKRAKTHHNHRLFCGVAAHVSEIQHGNSRPLPLWLNHSDTTDTGFNVRPETQRQLRHS